MPVPIPRLPRSARRLAWLTVALWLVVSALLLVGVLRMRHAVTEEVRGRMIRRTAAVLQPIVQDQVDRALEEDPELPRHTRMVAALVAHARQQGLLAMAVFDADGLVLETVPAAGALVELPLGDFLQLQSDVPISRYDPQFQLTQLPLTGAAGLARHSPVLEVVLPLQAVDRTEPLGYVRYAFDARLLAGELAAIDGQMHKQTLAIAGVCLLVVAGVFTAAYAGLRRAQTVIARGTADLARAESNLTLSAKASALGQITSHLMHGLQGSVAGLQAAMGTAGGEPDWRSAQEYTRRVHVMVQETIELLNDRRSGLAYELTGEELGGIILQRSEAAAREREVEVVLQNQFAGHLDNVRGNLIGLIVSNLLQNPIAVTAAGQHVRITITPTADAAPALQVEVADAGPGIPEHLRPRLFEPGCSGRPGGTGLGLALSRLLATQIDGDLRLAESSASGSRFVLTVALPEELRQDQD